MTELLNGSHNSSDSPARIAAELLYHYNFEPASCSIDQQIAAWLAQYPDQWLPFAIIEALYQGRYKTVSVAQILVIWHRRGQPLYHFNHEFERLIRGSLPRSPEASPEEPPAKLAPPPLKPVLSYRKMLLELPGVRAASRLERLNEIPSLRLALMRSGLDSRMATIDKSLPPAANGSIAAPATEPLVEPIAPVPPHLNPSPGATHSSPHPSPLALTDREFKEFKEGVLFGLSCGLAVRALAPRFRLELSRYYNPDWMKFLHLNTSIDQFTPTPAPPEFHSKLKSVVEPQYPSLVRSDLVRSEE